VRFEDGSVVADTSDVDRFSRRLPVLARDLGATLARVEPVGDDLESVYAYLTERARGRTR
jgi:ABC-2 type transport system ATP-binding protein